MSTSSFYLDGLDQFAREMDAINTKVKTRLMRKAANRGGRVVVKATRPRVPQRFRLLQMSLGVRVKKYRNTWVAVVGPRTNFKGKKAEAIRGRSRAARKASPAHYAHLVEHGTKPHIIEPNNAKALALLGAERPIYRVEHPGARPQPFLRPGFETSKHQAINEMGETLREGIEG